MTPSRLKAILRMAKRAAPAKVRDLYYEVYGAEAGSSLTIQRARESIEEACRELLDKGDRKAKKPEAPVLTPSDIRRRHVERALRRQS